MSENMGMIVGLNPGYRLTVADVYELAEFENVVASELYPGMSPAEMPLWLGRVPIGNLIRPPGFNGRITDITLTVMEGPYDQLVAHDSRCAVNSPVPEVTSMYRGYDLTARVQSTGRGVLSILATRMWYYPLRPNPNNRNKKPKNGGVSFNRIVAKPTIDTDALRKLTVDSRRIGHQVARRRLRAARPTGATQ